MQAVVITAHGGPEVLQVQQRPRPRSGPEEVLIRVRAVALNHVDLWTRQGLPGLDLEFPHIPGADVAGEIAEVGPGVTGWGVGQRVLVNAGIGCGRCEACAAGEWSLCRDFRLLGEHLPGGYAEYVKVPARNLLEMPEGASYEVSVAAGLAYMTAWRMLVHRAGVRPGETVLVIGAGGGVGGAAVQIARLAGGYVFATTSTAEKMEEARRLGAHEVINYREEDFSRAVWQRTGKTGVDLVVDSAGQAAWKGALRALKKGGRLVNCGATTGPQVELDLRFVFWRQLSILGSTMASQAEAQEVMDLVWQGRLQPVIHAVFPLSEARAAQEALEAEDRFGRIVLRVE